jgi:hypothetical protein
VCAPAGMVAASGLRRIDLCDHSDSDGLWCDMLLGQLATGGACVQVAATDTYGRRFEHMKLYRVKEN